MPGARPARAQTTTVWSATLNVVASTTTGLPGCDSTQCSSAITDNDFIYNGVRYVLRTTRVETGTLNIQLHRAIPADLKASLTLHVDGTALPLADATLGAGYFLVWRNTGLSWSAGDTVQLSLTGSTSSTTRDEPQQIFPALDRLPRHPSVEPFPARLRIPEGGSASDAYCYIGEGNDKTEYVRYPDGRIAETTRQSDAIRTAYACD